MDAGPKTIEKLFESSRQVFEIPTFQRPYVWRLDTQWEPLWEDIRDLAERYGELLSESGERSRAQKEAGRHFLGAVVIQRLERPFGAPETWELIDGQQRLTTLQLLLNAARDVFVSCGLEAQAIDLERVTRNDERLCKDDDIFKLWPTGGDQDAFRAVMNCDAQQHEASQLTKAHRYFGTQVREWLAPDDAGLAERGQHLLVTLLALLELVVIKLDGTDDAFVIFETMNARGTPLLAADLVKNYVLQTAVKQHKDKDAFHAEYWRQFEEERDSAAQAPWWLQEIRQGRIYRPRIDVFLNHWLVMRSGTEVKSRDLFPAFKSLVEEHGADDIEPVVQSFVHVAGAYRRLDQWGEHTPEGRFLYRWRVVQAGVLTPVLLQLFSADPTVLSVEKRARALGYLESFLVRRLVCRMTSKDYNRLFLELIGRLQERLATADDEVRAFLLAQDAHSRVWPTDEAMQDSIVDLPLYGRINQGRIRMVLEGLEERLRGPEAESQFAPRNLQLEHVMPRAWHTSWPLPEHDAEQRHQVIARRERRVHTLGNLTLLTGKLNRNISNSAWGVKRDAVNRHTTLYLNKHLLEQSPESFDDESIIERGRALGRLACEVWPRPKAEAPGA